MNTLSLLDRLPRKYSEAVAFESHGKTMKRKKKKATKKKLSGQLSGQESLSAVAADATNPLGLDPGARKKFEEKSHRQNGISFWVLVNQLRYT